MARPRNKEELITATNTNYDKMLAMIENRTEEERAAAYDFSADEKKKEAHWRRWIPFHRRNCLPIHIIHGSEGAASEAILSARQAVTMIGR